MAPKSLDKLEHEERKKAWADHEGLFSDLYEVIDHDYYNKWNFHPVTMSPGDAIIFDSYTPHFSAANTSDKQRRIVFLTYVDAQYEEAAAQFFSEKRHRQPPIEDLKY